ncbi:BRAP2 RING ZnF UBP domain-containing protein 1 [Cornus florida]|uniref:BRAP2 RING ZnF UBP domain-containing protein 1 n=1 Tax=Cornus florida TaxID=4283 RepID=UPI00289F6C60|nr:BRAP2 RING ZnF UBP domain-containing protein 1 [Cornus florida]XP_059635128.1 BRAP2 RING ZnF UBP domain-containing protein 1 [Cornus florida]
MFTLKIHSVDTPHPISSSTSTAAATTTPAAPSPNPNNYNIVELNGIIHLFRNRSPSATSLTKPSARTTLLFVAAVPNYLSPEDFLLFCGSHLDNFSELLFIRNDGMEDRYSVLIKLVNQLTADGFYCNFNGKRFKPSEAEVCHIFFTHSVEYTEFGEIASTPPPGFTELPTCPVCLERLDQDTSGIQSTLCDHSFHCSCISKWTYLSCQVCRLCQQQDEKPTCVACGALENLWVCVICSFVGCGRYEERHAIKHWKDTQHCYFLKLETQQVWDYVGDTYVHRLNQSKTDGKSTMKNSHWMSIDGHCGTCDYGEDSGISGALFSSKVEGIVDEYNHLLATQLEIQRQHYELLLAEAKSRRESSTSEAVEKAVASKMQDIQYEQEKFIEGRKIAEETNKDLVKNREVLLKKVKEIEEREVSSLRSRDEKIVDLEEQIRDLKVYVEAQRTLANMTDSDDIKGGTLLPVQSNQATPANSRRRTKLSRRRN